MPMTRDALQRHAPTAALAFVFLWFLLGGLGHFVSAAFFTRIVPPYIPFPTLVVQVSGVFELLGAAGLLLAGWRRPAAIGLFLLTLCVSPANINMWLHPEQFPLLPQPWLSIALSLRLVVQVFLLFCIWLGGIRRSDSTAVTV